MFDKYKTYLEVACFILLTPLLLLPGTLSPLGTYDEGIPLVAAQRIFAGETPYVDFWMMYPPAQGYLIALFSYFSGSFVSALRVVDLLTRVLLCFVVLAVNRVYLPTTIRLPIQAFVWLITILLLSKFDIQGYNVLPALLLALLSFWLFGRGSVFSLAAGLILGLLAAFRLDFFIYALVSYTLFLLLERISRRVLSRTVLVHVSMLVLGTAAIVFALAVAGSLVPDLFAAFVQQCLWTPLEVFPQDRSISYPTLRDIVAAESVPDQFALSLFFMGPGLLLIMMLVAVTVYYRRKPDLIDGKFLLLPLFGVLLLNQARVRSDFIHLAPLLFILVITLIVMSSMLIRGLPTQRLKRYRYGFSAGFVVLFVLLIYRNVIPSIGKIATCHDRQLSFERCILQDQDSRLESIEYVKQNVPPHERLLIVSDDNDHVDTNDVAFYALASRLPLTRFHELHPGIVTTKEAQLEIIRTIEESNIALILQQTGTAKNVFEEDTSPGLLDDYLHRHYEEVFSAGDYHFIAKIVDF